MLKVGITGGIGSGKSFISKILESFGYPVFYSDAVAKEIISTDAFVKNKLISFFGEEVFEENKLNRTFLANVIFNDDTALEKVNQLVHPLVRKAFDDFSIQQSSSLVFYESAILFETESEKYFDKVILVTAPKEIRISRVMKRDCVSEKEVLARMSKQWEDKLKMERADFIIENGKESTLLIQVENIVEQLTNQ